MASTAVLGERLTPHSPCGGDVARPARRRGRLIVAAGAVAAVATAGLLVLEVRNADLGAAFARTDPKWVTVAVGIFGLSIVSAAYNLTGFSALRLRLADTLLAQLAVGGLRMITPSALSTPAIATRYLVRSGASTPDALATVGASQTAQLLATMFVVAAFAGISGEQDVSTPGTTGLLVGAGVIAALVVAATVAARRSARIRRGVAAARTSLVGLAQHARRRPGRVASGLLASAVLTVAHVLAFAACVVAVGGHAPLIALCAVYLGASAAGSLIPTPSGIGAVEAALIGGLVATGIGVPAATAAALLSRLVSVWGPAVPGWFALVALRRRCLL
jgi:glycosyltransferase 2 family protein